MQTVTTGYRQAVQQAEQRPAARVRVDWDRNGNYTTADVASVTVDRTIVSDLPSEVTLISGTTAAVTNLELTGSPTDPASDAGMLYSPYQTASPLYRVNTEGAPATVEMGLQVGDSQEYLTQMVGQMRDLTVTATADGAQVSAQLVDGRQDFRFTPVLPVVVGDDVAGGLQPGLDAVWFVSAIARQAGYDAVPPLQTVNVAATESLLLSATLHGSAAPDPLCDSTLASAGTSQGDLLQFGAGAFTLGVLPDPVDGGAGVATYTSIVSFTLNDPGATDYLLVEMWCQPTTSSYPTGDVVVSEPTGSHRGVRLCNNGTNYILRIVGAASIDITGPVVANPTQWHYVAAYVRFDPTSAMTVKWNVDGATSTVTAGSITSVGGPFTSTLSTIHTYNAMEGVQVVRRYNQPTPVWSWPFTPTAVLEASLSQLTATPALPSASDAWTIVQDIARAVAGMVMLDERGVFQFWNRHHLGTATASTTTQRTIRASVPVTGMTVQRLADRIRNIVRVGVTPYQVGALSTVYALTDIVSIPSGGTWTRFVDFSPAQVYSIVTSVIVIPSGGALAAGQSGFRAARSQAGVTEVRNLGMTIIPGANSVTITVTNPNPYAVWLVSPSGSGYPTSSNGLPSLSVLGRLVTQTTTALDTTEQVPASTVTVEYQDAYSISLYGQRPVSIDASVWMQNTDDALALAQEVGFEISQPRPQWPPISIVADPALQIGDRVWLVDDSGLTGINDPAWIIGSTIRHTSDGAVQDLTLRPIAPPGTVILDDPDRGTLDGRWHWA